MYAIEAKSGDEWRKLLDQLNDLTSAMEVVKGILPEHDGVLDAMLKEFQAKVDRASKSRKLTKVISKDNSEELAFSSDVLRHKPHDPESTLLSITRAMNRAFGRGWTAEEGTEDDIEMAQSILEDTYDLEVNEGDLFPFWVTRTTDNRLALFSVGGVILPDGQILTVMEANDHVSDGQHLYASVAQMVRSLKNSWSDEE